MISISQIVVGMGDRVGGKVKGTCDLKAKSLTKMFGRVGNPSNLLEN